ncbi:hypothetical protein C8N46_102526 [Kordia periserrulae]|uniref:Uncharacterized protein n=1 Tax=Kordia periserrulae TaxID=701523 RepID=A0A2T6C4A9_9FLAO|nr:hypothetical protein [Kordia periserrulae]PTX63123.1 hypothetical protein C8N46_102526 [Kordia periserrulae]
MSRFSYTYTLLTTVKLLHESEFEAQNHVKIYPNDATKTLIEKHKLVVKMIPEGFVVLYKKQEEFVAQTVDEVVLIGEEEVTDQRIVGYASASPDPIYSNWLPEVIDIDLEFYAIADKTYKTDTDWDNLALTDFVMYSASDLEGTITENTSVKQRTKPDAILQLNIQEVNITTPESLTFEVNLNP